MYHGKRCILHPSLMKIPSVVFMYPLGGVNKQFRGTFSIHVPCVISNQDIKQKTWTNALLSYIQLCTTTCWPNKISQTDKENLDSFLSSLAFPFICIQYSHSLYHLKVHHLYGNCVQCLCSQRLRTSNWDVPK